MNKVLFPTIGLGVLLGISTATPAADSFRHFSESLGHSSQAIGHATVGSLKLISGSAAVPFLLSGTIGQAAGEIGDALWEEANRPMGEPLEITDEVITAGPSPSEAMQDEGEQQ